MARDWAFTAGYTKRLLWFDFGDEQPIGYNPLWQTDLPVATHAKALREAIRSAWGQSSFDQTPQLARLLFLALAVARTLRLTLADAVMMLRSGPSGSSFRQSLLGNLSEPFLYEALSWFDSLNERRQEELSASTLARLEAFVSDPIINRVLTHPQPLDISAALASNKILVVNLESAGHFEWTMSN
jgi:hypothetical protein